MIYTFKWIAVKSQRPTALHRREYVRTLWNKMDPIPTTESVSLSEKATAFSIDSLISAEKEKDKGFYLFIYLFICMNGLTIECHIRY